MGWTIALFTSPTDGDRTGTIRAGFLGRDKIGASVTRADIAAFLVRPDQQRALPPRRTHDQQLITRLRAWAQARHLASA